MVTGLNLGITASGNFTSAAATGLAAVDPDHSYYLTKTSYSTSESSTNAMTVAFWMKFDDTQTVGEQTQFRFQNSSGDILFLLRNNSTGGGQFASNGGFRFGIVDGSWRTDILFDASAVHGDGNWHHIMYAKNNTTHYAYLDGSTSMPPFVNSYNSYNSSGNYTTFNDYDTGVILAESTGGANQMENAITQLYIENTFIDISNSTNRAKFYDGGAVDMGTDGTGTGLVQPLHFFVGGLSDFKTDGGTVGTSWTENGTGIDVAAADGPQFGT